MLSDPQRKVGDMETLDVDQGRHADWLKQLPDEAKGEEKLQQLLDKVFEVDETFDLPTWRHADGSVRVDHMDSRPGDYFG